ncbi:CpaE family protein [Gryllotalpicola reticulitermitis]|uniref:CpaE family protein n=1 Tax=Gryllotalpicola reticulitermitis TaxID=1184153 RepID=A0ABV8QD36_9MICO
MARLAFSLERRPEAVLVPGAVDAGHVIVSRVQTAGELAAALAAHEIDLAVVSATRARLTRELVVAAETAGTRLVVLAVSADEHTVAAQAGGPDALSEPASWRELEEVLATTAASGPPTTEGAGLRGEASVVAVWGPAGAPGRSSLAIAMAAELADLGRTVALIDADTHGGSVAVWLGLLDEVPGFASACRLAGNDALSRAEFDRVAHYVPVRRGVLAVLTGIARPSRWPELSGERVARTIDAVAGWFDDVVIDVGFNLEADEEIVSDFLAPRRNAATLSALERATRVVAVGLADPVGLSRLMRHHPDAVAAAPGARHSVVANRVRPGVAGAAAEGQVAQALHRFGGIAAAALVPDDPAAFDAAMLRASPLGTVAPRSPARLAIRAFVEQAVLGLEPQSSRRGRRSPGRGGARRVPSRVVHATLDLSRVDPQ